VLNPYLKFVVAALSTVLTALGAVYGHSYWYPIATSAVGALLVYLVPNIPAPAKQVVVVSAPAAPRPPTVPLA
jgi:hypothetical protein